jgi:hypothetical protein
MSQQEFYLSARILRKVSACNTSLALFKKMFGLVVMLNRKNYYKWLRYPLCSVTGQRNYVYWLINQIDDQMRVRAGNKHPELRFYSQDWHNFSMRLQTRFSMSDEELYDFLVETVERCYKIRKKFRLGSIEDLKS